MTKRLPIPDKVRRAHARGRRVQRIRTLRGRGYSLREIGAALGISAQRVHQLLTHPEVKR